MPPRDASAPFHHTAAKYGRRRCDKVITKKGVVKCLYPGRPDEAAQKALMALDAICCTACPPWKMKEGSCHAHWLVDALKEKFGCEKVPEIVSGAIPDALKKTLKADPVARAEATAIHEEAFVEKKAVFVCRGRGNRGMPNLVPNLKLGTSQFGNPFSGVHKWANMLLFKAYMAKDFHPLTDDEIRVLMGGEPEDEHARLDEMALKSCPPGGEVRKCGECAMNMYADWMESDMMYADELLRQLGDDA
jgi:hypothetical protein